MAILANGPASQSILKKLRHGGEGAFRKREVHRMFGRQMTRLAVGVAAAGTICALGAATALAAPAAPWSGQKGPVPGAITNDTPSVSSITFPGKLGSGQLAAWRTRGTSGHIFYKYKVATLNKGHWSAKFELPGSAAVTSSAPVFRPYVDPSGAHAVLAAWTGPKDHHIWYEQGRTKSDGKISWTSATDLPSKVLYTDTSNAPAVLFLNHTYRVIFSWRGPANHVRYSVGTPAGRGFNWSDSAIVPGPAVVKGCTGAPCTADTPALAEQETSATSGTIYFFWRELTTTNILYSSTPDSYSNLAKPAFTGPTQVPGTGAVTDQAPAASDSTLSGFGPLLLAYKAPGSTTVRYQTFASGVWTAPATVPAHTLVAPALFINTLANTTPASDGNIVWHTFS
jgi:hypothetical protein